MEWQLLDFLNVLSNDFLVIWGYLDNCYFLFLICSIQMSFYIYIIIPSLLDRRSCYGHSDFI